MECFVTTQPVEPSEIGVDFQHPSTAPTVVIRGHLSALELLAASRGLVERPTNDLARTILALRRDAAEPLLAALFSTRREPPRYILRSLDELRGLEHRIVFTATAYALR